MGLNKIGLGTVQFSNNYGISNTSGKPDYAEIKKICDVAVRSNIGFIDTAPTYGDAEATIGKILPTKNLLKIITKMSFLKGPSYDSKDRNFLINTAKASLKKMKVSSVYGLLIHQSGCLYRTGSEYIIEALQILKDEGFAKKIGVSIYNAEEIDNVLDQFKPDIVQLPLSPLNQQLISSGHIKHLKNCGVEIQARSIFLQGLLLMNPDLFPNKLSPLKSDVYKFQKSISDYGISPLEACLSFGLQNTEIDAIILGVNSSQEFTDILSVAKKKFSSHVAFSSFASEKTELLDPVSWL